MAAPSVQPLGRAVLVEQADSNARRRDTPVAGQVIGGIHQQVTMPRCRHGSPTAIWRISGMPRRSLDFIERRRMRRRISRRSDCS
jgi:hypothetical protein